MWSGTYAVRDGKTGAQKKYQEGYPEVLAGDSVHTDGDKAYVQAMNVVHDNTVRELRTCEGEIEKRFRCCVESPDESAPVDLIGQIQF